MPFPPTDWGDFVPDEYAVGAPATAISFERWFRNPVAMAQAAYGAPRIVARAVKAVSSGIAGAGTSPATFIGLGDFETVTFCVESPGDDFLQISYTTDNGSSWTGWDTIIIGVGKFYLSYCRATNRMIPVSNASTNVSIINQPPAGLNGVRFRMNTGAVPFYVHIAAGGV